jgi:hypothetical protein
MLREALLSVAAGCMLSPAAAQIWQPVAQTTWQIQYSGTLDTSVPAKVFNVDLFDTPAAKIKSLQAAGKRVICYFSAGSWEDWRPDAGKYPKAILGKSLDNWAGERWVDIRRLDVLGPILAARMDLAVKKGCDAVDPDNVESWDAGEPTGFPLTNGDQLKFNLWLADQAHDRKLAIGLKNDLQQVAMLQAHFDFAVNEECFQYNECGLLKPFVDAGKAVFSIEYRGDPVNFCSKAKALGFSTIKKRLDLGRWRQDCLTKPGSSGHEIGRRSAGSFHTAVR